jgi:hypothetical protein
MNGDAISALFGIAIMAALGWVVPIHFGVRIAKSKGYSPHWMWFGVYPITGWITWLVLACLPQRHPCSTCGSFLGPRYRVCPYCGNDVAANPKTATPLLPEPLKDEGAPIALPPSAPPISPIGKFVTLFSLTVIFFSATIITCVVIATSHEATVSGTFCKANPTTYAPNEMTKSCTAVGGVDDLTAMTEDSEGYRLMAAEQYDEVLRRANASIASHPYEPTPYALRGAVRSKQSDFSNAASDYSLAIQILARRTRNSYWDEKLSFYYFGRSWCYASQCDGDKAIFYINKSISLQQNAHWALNNRGLFRELFYRDLKGALEDYESARRLNSVETLETLYQTNVMRVSRMLGK